MAINSAKLEVARLGLRRKEKNQKKINANNDEDNLKDGNNDDLISPIKDTTTI